MVDPVAGRLGRPLAIAHRGDPIPLRENTAASIRSAVDVGADIVEIDVKTTSDGVSVVLHDDSLLRLWGVERDIRTMTAAEVAEVGEGDTRIPTLEQVLALFTDTSCAVMVDMDSGEWAAAAQDMVRRAVTAEVVDPPRSALRPQDQAQLVTVRDQPAGQVGPDESGSAGEEDPLHVLVRRDRPVAADSGTRSSFSSADRVPG